MRAMTVVPGDPSSAKVSELAEPEPSAGDVLVEGVLVGICGTDQELVHGSVGYPMSTPDGRPALVLGHESFGLVRSAPPGSGLTAGDPVVGVVRRPDPEPCPACARGAADFCSNGGYTEHGIRGLDGFGSQLWRVPVAEAVPVPQTLGEHAVLVEPASVVAKAWDQIAAVDARTPVEASRALITGAGPIGLLAALLGRQRGLDVTVLDQVIGGPKPELVRGIGARYETDVQRAVRDAPDVVIECTGNVGLVLATASALAPGGVLCLAGILDSKTPIELALGEVFGRFVGGNRALIGTVNAGRRHFDDAITALSVAETGWLEQMIGRRVPLQHWPIALERDPEEVKTVVDLRD